MMACLVCQYLVYLMNLEDKFYWKESVLQKLWPFRSTDSGDILWVAESLFLMDKLLDTNADIRFFDYFADVKAILSFSYNWEVIM